MGGGLLYTSMSRVTARATQRFFGGSDESGLSTCNSDVVLDGAAI